MNGFFIGQKSGSLERIKVGVSPLIQSNNKYKTIRKPFWYSIKFGNVSVFCYDE